MIPDNVLKQLQDIQTPPPAGLWPLAPGWWILAGLTVTLLVTVGAYLWLRYRRNAPKRAALARLADYPIPDNANPGWYAGLNQLLKETALTRYPEDNPAGLSGDQWGQFLAATSGDPGRPWQQLVSSSFRPHSELPPADAHLLAEHWVRRQSW